MHICGYVTKASKEKQTEFQRGAQDEIISTK